MDGAGAGGKHVHLASCEVKSDTNLSHTLKLPEFADTIPPPVHYSFHSLCGVIQSDYHLSAPVCVFPCCAISDNVKHF